MQNQLWVAAMLALCAGIAQAQQTGEAGSTSTSQPQTASTKPAPVSARIVAPTATTATTAGTQQGQTTSNSTTTATPILFNPPKQ